MSEHASKRKTPPGYVRLEGSQRRPLPGARRVGPADPDETFTVTVRVRRRPGAPAVPDHGHWMNTPPGRRNFITHDEFSKTYGAARAELETVAAFGRTHGMTVTATSIAGRTVTLSGTVRQMSKAFAIDLGRYESRSGDYRGRDGFVYVPRELSGIVRAVFGLDNRRVGFHNAMDPPGTASLLSPSQVAQAYNFPQAPPDASSQRIGVIEFADTGGNGWTSADVTNTLTWWLATATKPTIVDVGTGNSQNSDSETILDVCTASLIAPGATIQVYWGNDSLNTQDWFTIIDRIWHNPQKGDPPSPQVLSISWTLVGGDDVITSGGVVSSATIDEISADFQDMANAGITILVASGDGGSLGWNDAQKATAQGGNTDEAHVAYPASDPWVTTCGGTTLSLTATGQVNQEFIWNDIAPDGVTPFATGGGISAYFTMPTWQVGVVSQTGLNPNNMATGRGVPDVAGNASLQTGFNVSLSGIPIPTNPSEPEPPSSGPFCGTSAVAPMYAGLVAMINARLGYQVGFLNPTLYAFRNSVCRDINDQVYTSENPPLNNQLSGTSAPGYPSGPGWDACTGLGVINPVALSTAVQSNFYFVVDKGAFGVDEVTDNPSWPSSFWLFLEGFKPSAVGSSLPTLSGTFTTNIPGLQITPGTPIYDVGKSGANANVAQRIRFSYDVKFTTSGSNSSLPAFPATGAEAFFSLSATITIQGNQLPLTPTAEIELVGGADPYFTNVNPDQGNFFYLSQDLRVFTIIPGTTVGTAMGAPTLGTGGVPDGYTFIKELITFLNNQIGYPNNTSFSPPTDPASPDPLDTILPTQTGALTGDSSVTPGTSSQPNFNFAIARVRLKGAGGTTTTTGVSVFFRLFSTQTNDTDFINTTVAGTQFDSPNVTYPTAADGVPAAGTDLTGTINGSTLPFFATENYDANPTDYNGGPNNQIITIPSGQDYVWAFFGCFLNVYDKNNVIASKTIQEWLGGGTHHCLVAQIEYADAPITNTSGVVASPENNDKLAQRNLQITSSGNPSFPVTHRIPQTFDLRPSPVQALATGPLAGYPDELMIDWGQAPHGSAARIYWPAVSSSDVLALAARLYPNHLLSAVDGHTVECRSGGGVAYVPIPAGGNQSFAGLITVELAAGIRVGNQFEVVVRRITSRRPIHSRDDAQPAGSGQIAVDWRYIVGTFTARIPVQRDRTILPDEENLLAILKWRLSLSAGDRWHPVLRRYVDYVSARVNGMGGNAATIPAADAYYPVPEAGHGGPVQDHQHKGKIVGIVYDRFGDFEGFLLETEAGEDRRFKSTEFAVEALVRRAWEDRILVAVHADRLHPERVASIILRRLPRQEW
jgi:hypothetical protein